MVTVTLLSLFPQVLSNILDYSIVKKAVSLNKIQINFIDIRNFAQDKYKSVDDHPYGGGAGMVMRIDVLHRAIIAARKLKKSEGKETRIILTDPKGAVFNQNIANKYALLKHLIIICGHYEGVDARIDNFIDEKISIGDYILTGGEIPALAITDTITRLIPGVLAPQSPIEESFSKNLLEYPQYTRPEKYKGYTVPSVLLSGHHAEILSWRQTQSEKNTKKYRPDLYKKTR